MDEHHDYQHESNKSLCHQTHLDRQEHFLMHENAQYPEEHIAHFHDICQLETLSLQEFHND